MKHMFKRTQSTFISSSIILQGFWAQNPKYRRGNVKGIGWVHGLDEQGIWIGINHGTLLVWISEFLLFLDHGDVTWDCPKGRVLGRGDFIFRNNFLEKKGESYRYFVVKNHRLCFDISFYFIFVMLDFIKIKHKILL